MTKTTKQKIIDLILDKQEQQPKNSLQEKALNRALNGGIPRTMTPFEWEDWYKQQEEIRKQ